MADKPVDRISRIKPIKERVVELAGALSDLGALWPRDEPAPASYLYVMVAYDAAETVLKCLVAIEARLMIEEAQANAAVSRDTGN